MKTSIYKLELLWKFWLYSNLKHCLKDWGKHLIFMYMAVLLSYAETKGLNIYLFLFFFQSFYT